MKFRILPLASVIVGLVCVLATTGFTTNTGFTVKTVTDPALQLHVQGNELVNANGSRVVLRGVDRSGSEYECVQHLGIFAGPTDQASVAAMKAWGITAVRVPLNEACWNSESYVKPAYAGMNYQLAVYNYVQLLNANGIVAILDLHWSDGSYTGTSSQCTSAEAVCQKPMPDAAQAVPFWTSVARTFKNNDAVIFDLFNEPFPNKALPTEAAAWECWLEGGSSCSPGITYPVAGMQQLVDTVRATGADNVIMLGGLAYANDLTGWLKYEPTDPDSNLVASWHAYSFNSCKTQSCWTSQISPVIASVPVVVGEMGESDCADDYIDPLMAYLDSKSTSYLAWAWNANFNCGGGPGLITSYTGTPTAYGAGYMQHLQSFTQGLTAPLEIVICIVLGLIIIAGIGFGRVSWRRRCRAAQHGRGPAGRRAGRSWDEQADDTDGPGTWRSERAASTAKAPARRHRRSGYKFKTYYDGINKSSGDFDGHKPNGGAVLPSV